MPDHIARGESQLLNAARLVSQLSPSKAWKISISEYRAKRSNSQNDMAWAIYRAVAKETGATPEEVHYGYKSLFGEWHEWVDPVTKKKTGEFRTRGTDTPWFSEYLERVMAHAATEFGVILG